MAQNEFDLNIIMKPCAVCGIIKPLADFLSNVINLSSISQIKKYSEICMECRSNSIQIEEKINIKSEKNINYKTSKKIKLKQLIDDDDSSGGGKGKRLTSDNYAKISAIFRKDINARVDTTIKGIDEGFRESTRHGMGRKR